LVITGGIFLVDFIPLENNTVGGMWQVELTTQWQKDARHYEKKHPAELAAVLRNLKRYVGLLEGARNSRAVQAGFLHGEGKGVVAVDQKGGGGSLQETRLYTYADEAKKVLYLITLGNKNEQPTDVELSNNFVETNFPQGQRTSGAPDQTT
jgi:hypothetical protein